MIDKDRRKFCCDCKHYETRVLNPDYPNAYAYSCLRENRQHFHRSENTAYRPSGCKDFSEVADGEA